MDTQLLEIIKPLFLDYLLGYASNLKAIRFNSQGKLNPQISGCLVAFGGKDKK